MKHYHKNPRRITKKQFADLQYSLDKFGDLSGVVHNLLTDEVIGGNQRSDVFDIKDCLIDVVERLEEPDRQGTVARGWVVWKGMKYTYRAVMWDEEWAAEANIRANKAGGSWDMDILANQFSIPELIEWGFAPYEIGIAGEADDPTAEWTGMPEFENENVVGDYHTIKVHFSSVEDMEKFAQFVEQPITEKTKYVWYPKQERLDLKQYRVEDES